MVKKSILKNLSNKVAFPTAFQNVSDTVSQASEDYKIELLKAMPSILGGDEPSRYRFSQTIAEQFATSSSMTKDCIDAVIDLAINSPDNSEFYHALLLSMAANKKDIVVDALIERLPEFLESDLEQGANLITSLIAVDHESSRKYIAALPALARKGSEEQEAIFAMTYNSIMALGEGYAAEQKCKAFSSIIYDMSLRDQEKTRPLAIALITQHPESAAQIVSDPRYSDLVDEAPDLALIIAELSVKAGLSRQVGSAGGDRAAVVNSLKAIPSLASRSDDAKERVFEILNSVTAGFVVQARIIPYLETVLVEGGLTVADKVLSAYDAGGQEALNRGVVADLVAILPELKAIASEKAALLDEKIQQSGFDPRPDVEIEDLLYQQDVEAANQNVKHLMESLTASQ